MRTMRTTESARLAQRFGKCLSAGLFALLVLAGTASVAAAQRGPEAAQRPVEHGPEAPRPSGGVLGLLPADAVTAHVIEVGERKLAYTATAGTFSLFDGNGERSAAVYYTAYVLKDAPRDRPVTFVFNGGPGASSAYLHLGFVGPRVVDFGPDHNGARAQLRDNPETWLAFTDLVFIDPVGTGWSRAAKPDNNGGFWGVRQDASSFAKVIALYTARNGRGSSPKYLLGESYGGFRAVKVARALQNEQGIVTEGIVMVSPFLEGALQWGATRFALGAALQFPSLAAAALDRERRFSPEALAAAERFAMTDYLLTLAGPPPQGDAATAFYARVAEFTGIPVDVVKRARGFLHDVAAKNARLGEGGEIVSAYDAAFVAPDPFPESLSHEGSDPILDGFLQALGGAFVGYARDELAFKTEMTFMLLNREVSGKWDWGGGRMQAGAMADLREHLSLNPRARVLIGHGRSDLVTPHGVTRYLLDHMPPFGEASRATMRIYKGGHMFYLDGGARRDATADARAFYGEAP